MLHIHSFTFSPIQENTYLLYNEAGQCAIIDPGCYYPEEEAELASFITEKNLQPVLLLQTHGHLDHVFGTRFVAERYGLQPHLHPAEKIVFDYAATAGLMYNMPFDSYTGPIQHIKEGETVSIGEEVLQVLFTPGHSPGSISFYYASQQLLISGDVLFQQSIGRTDLPGGDFDTLLNSIRTQLFTLPDEVIVYSGHGPATTIGAERRGNPFLC